MTRSTIPLTRKLWTRLARRALRTAHALGARKNTKSRALIGSSTGGVKTDAHLTLSQPVLFEKAVSRRLGKLHINEVLGALNASGDFAKLSESSEQLLKAVVWSILTHGSDAAWSATIAACADLIKAMLSSLQRAREIYRKGGSVSK